jgi:hypothetical protein
MVCSGAASCCAALAAALRRGRLAASVSAIIITMSRRPRRAGREKGHIKAAEAPRRETGGYKDRAPRCYYEGRADELWCNQQQLRQPEGMVPWQRLCGRAASPQAAAADLCTKFTRGIHLTQKYSIFQYSTCTIEVRTLYLAGLSALVRWRECRSQRRSRRRPHLPLHSHCGMTYK